MGGGGACRVPAGLGLLSLKIKESGFQAPRRQASTQSIPACFSPLGVCLGLASSVVFDFVTV